MASCPACDTTLPDGDVVQCACGQWSRLEEVPERPCTHCGGRMPLKGDAVRCPSCHRLQATDATRAVHTVADCPRCRRCIEVPADDATGSCSRCGQVFHVRDTL